jgi:acyl dehydratase
LSKLPEHSWYFDDFEVGQVHTTMGRTVTEADLVNFVTFSGIFEEIFINAEYARRNSLFEGRVVPGMLILVVAEGLYVQTGHTHHGRAFLGLDELRIAAPVLCGDTIHAEVSVESARPSGSRPGHGILTMSHKVLNQNGIQVMSYKTTRLLEARAARPVPSRRPGSTEAAPEASS